MAADDNAGKIAELLHEVSETHHTVYRITDGADDDWASFYADRLIDHSELPALLGEAPVRSHLVHTLVQLGRDYDEQSPERSWEDFYAERIVEDFGGG